ncbi:winged helix-turn-helix transcriptional regulator [Aquimarina macrocephali]|uniref:winged helix-turn-helix transcriptional regulator n=1 Tax=Aquimarina macrocephali TaxID=666563 RepID=UPI0004676AF5|nr:helix-turn-helix domain-containing protein [Aquimarina macrocephali]
MKESKSYCPINLSLEIIGDKWTLIIIRDIMMVGKRHFRELLKSDEKIASNILSNRLAMLEKRGILTKKKDDSHKQKHIYSLTQMGIDLFPVIMDIGVWASKHLPVDKKLTEHLKALIDGGEKKQKEFLEELKNNHLD